MTNIEANTSFFFFLEKDSLNKGGVLFDPRNPNDGLIASQQQGYWQIAILILLLISMQTTRLLTHKHLSVFL